MVQASGLSSGSVRCLAGDGGGANAYAGGTRIEAGTLQVADNANLGAGGTALSFGTGRLHATASFTLARNVVLDNTATFDIDVGKTLSIPNPVSGDGRLVKSGAGTLLISGNVTHAGGTLIEEGTLQIGNSTGSGSLAGDVENHGVLAFDYDLGTGTHIYAGRITGDGILRVREGAVQLTGEHSYTGGTVIDSAGSLSIKGSIIGDIQAEGLVDFDLSDGNTRVFDGLVSGGGLLTASGPGTLVLTADNTIMSMSVSGGGTLLVHGNQSHGMLSSVNTGGTLGGTGILGGGLNVLQGRVAPGDGDGTPGILTITGDLFTAPDGGIVFDFGKTDGGDSSDLLRVGGNIWLRGTIDVNAAPGREIGPGLYRLIEYGGTVTENTSTLGTTPAGSDLRLQTAIAHEVNLVSMAGHVVQFWDGDAGPKLDGVINGGAGVWQAGAGSDNWTDENGAVNTSFVDDAFVVFAGESSVVQVDDSQGPIHVSGMQFASDGYYIFGSGSVSLSGTDALVRVGDGTAASAHYLAVIEADLAGPARLVKADAGRLELLGSNSHRGTAIRGGTLAVIGDNALGAWSAALEIDGGTLETMTYVAIGRPVMFAGDGGLHTHSGIGLSGTLAGSGRITKTGIGHLHLVGSGDHSGGIDLVEGELYLDGDYAAAGGTITVRSGTRLGGTMGSYGGDVVVEDGGTLAPGAFGVAAGTLEIGGDLVLSANSKLEFHLGATGTEGGDFNDLVRVGGDLVLAGTLDLYMHPDGAFGPGVYTLFTYGGALTYDPGTFVLGSQPAGSTLSLRTSVPGKVLLVNGTGFVFHYWDGGAGNRYDGVFDGGSGTWSLAPDDENWTNEDASVNGGFANGRVAVFMGAPGTVTIDNSHGAVEAAGLEFRTDGYVIAGDALTLAGPFADITVDDGVSATIAAELAGATQLVKKGDGALVLDGMNSYTGGTSIEGGVLAVSDDANLGDAAGAVTLVGGTLRILGDMTTGRDIMLAANSAIEVGEGVNFTYSGKLGGAGRIEKADGGRLDLAGDNAAFSGTARVSGGLLAVNGSFGGTVEVGPGGRLGGTGRIARVVNGGAVAPGNSIGTLTIAGDYVGNGGAIEIEAVLGGDHSPADLLVVEGNTSGSSFVRVINLGGAGAATQEGIRIIDVAGKSEGSFTLIGDYTLNGEPVVVAGAYGYRLHKNGISTPDDGDWYLRSTLLEEPGDPADPVDPAPAPLYQPGVPLYESYSHVLQALNRLPTARERLGGRAWSDAQTTGQWGFWGRLDGESLRPKTHVSTTRADLDVDSWQVQMGLEAELHRGNAGMLTGGLAVHYGEADANVVSAFGAGSIDARGYGLGASVTWYGAQGFYADAQLQLTLFDSDLRSNVLGPLKRGNDAMGEAVGIEIGQRVAIGGNFAVTPQAQVTYAHMDFDMFRDSVDAEVSLSESSSLKTRLGVALDHQSAWERNGDLRRSSLYGIVNVSYEWEDGSVVNVSGTQITRRDRRLWGELGLGASHAWGDGRYSIHGEVSAETPLADFGDGYALRGTAGFRIRF